jgi:hypothetical protein
MAAETPVCNFGEPARPFDLPATDGVVGGVPDPPWVFSFNELLFLDQLPAASPALTV